MEEVRQWITEWKRFQKEPLSPAANTLLAPIKGNDSVLNELLASELVQNHLVDFSFSLISHADSKQQQQQQGNSLSLNISTFLFQSSSHYCRKLAAMCVAHVLLLEWLSTDGVKGQAVKCLETIFVRQEQSIHPMPPTIRIPAINSNPPRELSNRPQYYYHHNLNDGKAIFGEVSRLPITIRLCLLFIDFGSDAPRETICLFNICWIIFLSGPSLTFPDNLLAEISDIFTTQKQAKDVELWMEIAKSKHDYYSAINEDVIMLLIEWIPFAMEHCPSSSKILWTLTCNKARSECYSSALLVLNIP